MMYVQAGLCADGPFLQEAQVNQVRAALVNHLRVCGAIDLPLARQLSDNRHIHFRQQQALLV